MKIFKDKIIDLRCGRKVCLIPPLCNEFHFPKYFVLNWIFKWILKLAGSVLSGGFTFRRLERVVCQLVDFSEKFWLFVYGEGGGARASNSTCLVVVSAPCNFWVFCCVDSPLNFVVEKHAPFPRLFSRNKCVDSASWWSTWTALNTRVRHLFRIPRNIEILFCLMASG